MNAVLRSVAECQVTRRGAFAAAGNHAAGVKRSNAEGVGGLFGRPAQKPCAGCGDSERTAYRAWPPTMRKQFRRIDAAANSNDGLVPDDCRFEKFPPAAIEFFCHRQQSRNDHSTDTYSCTAVNVIHLTTVSGNAHRLDSFEIRNSLDGSEER